jgi:hypothetical protein
LCYQLEKSWKQAVGLWSISAVSIEKLRKTQFGDPFNVLGISAKPSLQSLAIKLWMELGTVNEFTGKTKRLILDFVGRRQ